MAQLVKKQRTPIRFVTPGKGLIYFLMSHAGDWSWGKDLNDAIANYPGDPEDYLPTGGQRLYAYLGSDEITVKKDGSFDIPIGTKFPILIAVFGGEEPKEDILANMDAWDEGDDEPVDETETEDAELQEYEA